MVLQFTQYNNFVFGFSYIKSKMYLDMITNVNGALMYKSLQILSYPHSNKNISHEHWFQKGERPHLPTLSLQ